MKYVYVVYQYLVALPILVGFTLFTAILTIIALPWKNSRFIYSVQQIWARSFCRLMFIPVSVEGMENIDPKSSYVFVSNHQSAFDIFVIYGWLPNIFKWLMKKEIGRIPFVGAACRAAGHITIDRSSSVAAMESLRLMERELTDGVSTVIFPEGTRTRDGELGRFKRGAFQVAFDLSLPIVPISLSGCYDVMPKGAKYVTRHAIKMTIGKPISLASFPQDDPQQAIAFVRDAVHSAL